MDSVSIDIRLRPIRFGFVVRPNDKARLRSIFQVNTCLWGGRFNPIIPYLTRVPAWWERKGYKFENAKQIENGYLEFFEPDFLVEAEEGLARNLGYDPARILQLSEVLKKNRERDHRGVGFDVLDLYRTLYKEEFQFVRRHPHTVVEVAAKKEMFADFSACVFGDFPIDDSYSYFRASFEDVFEPEKIALDAASLERLYSSRTREHGISSPLMIGSTNISIDYHKHGGPTLFVLDAAQPRDLIDFWNYRAVHGSVLAMPVQWLEPLSAFCKTLITKNFRPLPGNPNGVMIRLTTMFARSISDDDIQDLYPKYLQTETPGANVVQTWYPPIWRPTPEFVVRTSRPTLECSRRSIEATVDDESYIRFDTLYPEFAERFGSEHRWANVIRIKDWSHKGSLATVFPTDVRQPAIANFSVGLGHLLSTTEGLVIFPRFKDVSNRWQLTEGASAIARWLKKNQIKLTLSEAGRSTQQIIQTLGGFWGASAVAHKDIVLLLDHMARKPITRSAHRHEFENRISAAVGKDIWRRNVFKNLVERKAVELGYELKCTKCGSWGWHALSELGPAMTCALCLRQFNFPITDPSNSDHARWAYRVIGPFALPKYANGGYAAALAVRFFGSVISSVQDTEITWAGGHDLIFENGPKAEVDFALWYQRKEMFGPDHPTEIIFGEAKSFGKDVFKDEDIGRMRLLADRFPGSVFVFATMKEGEELSADEIRRIRRFAEWGREYDRDRRRVRASVVVLTGTELFSAYRLEQSWKEKGGLREQLVSPGYVELDRLSTLADFTQQAYLGMPTYDRWMDEKWKARQSRKKGGGAAS